MLYELTASPIFGIAITCLTYALGLWLSSKAKTPLINPLLISVVLIIIFLVAFGIPYDHYQEGGKAIELFLVPATAILAVKVYEQFELLKKNWLPVLLGAAVGSAVSIVCVVVLSKLCALDETLTISLLPKSVTMAIALPLVEQYGGVPPITGVALFIAGIMGALFAPYLIRLFHIKNPVESGLAIGTASHALGTSKALELGDVEGAISSCAIGVAGLFTVLWMLFLF
jgi:predicted murein hydrolase (TIGR00659 family)